MKVLWIKSDFLYPPDTGGKIRSYHILKRLAAACEISYLCLTEEEPSAEDVAHLRSFCKRVDFVPLQRERKFSAEFYLALALNLLSPRPYVINKYRHPAISAEIARRVAAGEVNVLVCDFLEMSINLRRLQGVPQALFQHNVESEIWRRHYQVSRNLLKRLYLFLDYLKMRRYEKETCSRFDAIMTVSEADGKLLQAEFGAAHYTVIPTGVDTEYFHPCASEAEADSLVFVGSMDWLPNQDAIAYFVSEILPLIKARRPGVKLAIVGRRPPERVVRYANQDAAITVTGTVADVRPYVDRAAVYIVPLRIGGGTRIKIFEAMAQAKAVVSTSVGAEGLPVRDGKHILIADTPERFAEAVCLLLEDRKRAARLGKAAYDMVTQKHSWEKVALHFSIALEKMRNHHHRESPVGSSTGERRA